MSPSPDSDPSNKGVYERREEFRRDIEREVDPLDAAASATDKAAIELGQSIIKTGTLLNGAAIIAMPPLVNLFGIDTKAVIFPLIIAGLLFSAGLMFSWASALLGFFALGARSHAEHWFGRATYLRIQYSYFPIPDTDKQKEKRMSEIPTFYADSKRRTTRFERFRMAAIILSLLSLVAFISGSGEAGWTILHAPVKPPLIPSVERTR
jgi:hypothetical protein